MTGLTTAPEPQDDDRFRRHALELRTEPGTGAEMPEPVGSDLDRLLRRARQKMTDGAHHAAMALLNNALRLDRTRAETYVLQAECLLAGDEPARAQETAEAARQYTGDTVLLARIDAVVSRCRAAITAEYLELARACLRRRDPQRALAHLEHAPDVSPDIVTYARGDRLLDPPQLEAVLRWLTQEELAAARQALDERDHDRAGNACRAAWKIDPRGRECALLSARTCLGHYSDELSRPGPRLERQRGMLLQARDFVRKAADDATLQAERAPVAAYVEKELRGIAERIVQHAADEEVSKVVASYNAVIRAYQRRTLYQVEARNMLASLAPIDVKVAKLREAHRPGSPQGQVLKDVAESIADLRRRLR